MWPPREASHPSGCVPSQKRPSLLKNSSAAAATFRDQDTFHFNAESWSNLGTKTRIRPVLTVGPLFSTGWGVIGTGFINGERGSRSSCGRLCCQPTAVHVAAAHVEVTTMRLVTLLVLVSLILPATARSGAAQEATPAGPPPAVEPLVTTTFPAASLPTSTNPTFFLWHGTIAPKADVAIPAELVACAPDRSSSMCWPVS